MNGYWVFSPGFGYTWVSSYPWGWLPFRFGNWVYINNRGWCWAPGGWSRWNTGPRWVNAPPGFRPSVPPANGTVVVGGSPGRVIRPGNAWDRGGPHLGGRAADRDSNNAGSRANVRVFTNDDIQGRVPRTDVPVTQPSSSGAVSADRKLGAAGQQPAAKGGSRQSWPGGSWPDRQTVRIPEDDAPIVGTTRPAEVPRGERAIPAAPQQVAPPSQPVRQYTPPPASAPPPAVHQAPASAPPARSFSPSPAASTSHSSGDEGGSRGGKPR